jgi:hypothetical protein
MSWTSSMRSHQRSTRTSRSKMFATPNQVCREDQNFDDRIQNMYYKKWN